MAIKMPALIMLLLLKSKKQINKPPTFQKKVQKDYTISAPLFLSTPFCENRYQKIAALAEWCFFFCDIFPKCKGFTREYIKSCVLYGKVTAFAYTIRAPPSEI